MTDRIEGCHIAAEPSNKLDPEIAETEVTGLTFAANDAVEFSDATVNDEDCPTPADSTVLGELDTAAITAVGETLATKTETTPCAVVKNWLVALLLADRDAADDEDVQEIAVTVLLLHMNAAVLPLA